MLPKLPAAGGVFRYYRGVTEAVGANHFWAVRSVYNFWHQNSYIPEKIFKQAFNEHCRENNLTKEQWSFDFYSTTFSSNSITKFGNILRKFKLDELPQSYNIIKNEMTLIGPRPCLASQNELIRERNKKDIFSVKPGITGLAQINNIDMSNPKKLALWDERYVKIRCIILDIKIAIYTLVGK